SDGVEARPVQRREIGFFEDRIASAVAVQDGALNGVESAIVLAVECLRARQLVPGRARERIHLDDVYERVDGMPIVVRAQVLLAAFVVVVALLLRNVRRLRRRGSRGQTNRRDRKDQLRGDHGGNGGG